MEPWDEDPDGWLREQPSVRILELNMAGAPKPLLSDGAGHIDLDGTRSSVAFPATDAERNALWG